jgi:hypothetical protein
MRSYWIGQSGSETALELREVAVPEPAAGQLLVRVFAFDELPRAKALMESNVHTGKLAVSSP